jgi:hypothetical protein
MTAKPPIRISDEVRREIQLRAYLIWESEGCPHGREKEHWRRAEAEILTARMLVKAVSGGKATKPKAAAPKAATKAAATNAAAKAPAKAKTEAKTKPAAKTKTSKTVK